MQTWNITRTLYRVSDFLSWQRNDSLVLSPSFQRRPVWQIGAKSFLIDTVIRGLPMPIIFLREQKTSLSTLEPCREVVDGQQRLRTIISYVEPTSLKDFNPATDAFTINKNHNPKFKDRTFAQLPADARQRILDYQFSVHVLPAEVDDREVIQLFARMNATGVQLNPQELRNAEYYGELRTLMYELAAEQLQRWREWKIFTEHDIARMQEVELVSEFALLAEKGVTGKAQKSLNQLYQRHDENYPRKPEFEHRFRSVMDSIDSMLGKDMSSLPFRKRTLFYSLFALFYGRQFGFPGPLVRKRAVTSRTTAWLKEAALQLDDRTAPKSVLDAAASRTTHPSSRTEIIRFLDKS